MSRFYGTQNVKSHKISHLKACSQLYRTETRDTLLILKTTDSATDLELV